MTKEITYSFSRLDSFHNCKRAYYNTYILSERGGDNVYSYLGTVTHELVQGMILGQETNESAVEKFIEAIDDIEMLGLEWISENVKNNYVECIVHFLQSYVPVKNNTIRIEDQFEVEVNGDKVKGFIDLWYRIDDTIYIIDLKTSSKFSKADLPKKSRQLLIYALALQERYPDVKIVLQFNMMKYALNSRGTLKERNKFDMFDDYSEALINVDITDESIKDVKYFINDTVKQINSLGTDKENWTMDKDVEKDFFCKNLCSFRDKCLQEI